MSMPIGELKVLERRLVSPPPGSVSPAELPLTYYDVALLSIPVQQLFFFDLPLSSSQDFRDSQLPLLERSLSLALAIFYPLAGRLFPVPDSLYPGDCIIRYSDGDSVSLTVAESDAEFARLVGNQAKEVQEFQSLVPPEMPFHYDDLGTPLVAFQITVFPGSGISIGLSMNHAVTDGFGRTHFFKTWASIFKADGDVSVVKDLPVFDRTLLGDIQHTMKQLHLEEEAARTGGVGPRSTESEPEATQIGIAIRSTFVLTRAHIQYLRDRISSESNRAEGPRLSTFTITCAYVWVCLAKSLEVPEGKLVYFGFPVNLRRRLDPPVPASYFGNCVTMGAVIEMSRAELAGQNGLSSASEAIHRATRRVNEGILKDALAIRRKWRGVQRARPKERPLSTVGSPLFRVYETDFGWGQPCKVEIVSIDHDEAMSLAESRDHEGGVEIGLAGPKPDMLRFSSYFNEGLRAL